VQASLRSPIQKIMVSLVCLALTGSYAVRVVRMYLAGVAASSYRASDLESAVRLAPENAEYAHALGLQLSASPDNYARAIANLERAVALNPQNGSYWLDLASVYQLAGEPERQRPALESALAAEPNNPDVSAEAANYFLADGDTARSLSLLRRTLQQDPSAAESLLPVFWRVTQDPKMLLEQAVPPDVDNQMAFLRLATAQNDPAIAREAWDGVIASKQAVAPQLTFFYFEYLIHNHDIAELKRSWSALGHSAASIVDYQPGENRIVNGGFELPVLNAGLDWRYEAVEHVNSSVEESDVHSGTRALHLFYDGNASYDAGWREYVIVEPGAAYQFSAWVKSDNILSSSGPRFSMADAITGAPLFLSDDVLDTHPWQEIHGHFQVPAGTDLAEIKITRWPANTKIRGEVTVDDIRLFPDETSNAVHDRPGEKPALVRTSPQ
jgi:hypothetical protein